MPKKFISKLNKVFKKEEEIIIEENFPEKKKSVKNVADGKLADYETWNTDTISPHRINTINTILDEVWSKDRFIPNVCLLKDCSWLNVTQFKFMKNSEDVEEFATGVFAYLNKVTRIDRLLLLKKLTQFAENYEFLQKIGDGQTKKKERREISSHPSSEISGKERQRGKNKQDHEYRWWRRKFFRRIQSQWPIKLCRYLIFTSNKFNEIIYYLHLSVDILFLKRRKGCGLMTPLQHHHPLRPNEPVRHCLLVSNRRQIESQASHDSCSLSKSM